MTKQITIKLNEKKFKPVLESLKLFAGAGTTESDSDLVAKCVYLCYDLIYNKRKERGYKTTLEIIQEAVKKDKPTMILDFLKDYYNFKKKGLPKIQ